MADPAVSLIEQLSSTTQLFLDTAPVIYFVEQHPRYLPLLEPLFQRLDAGELTAITSPITLAECLVLPLRQEEQTAVQIFIDLIVDGPSTHFHPIGQSTGKVAARLRAQHNLTLPDALQVAVALDAGCDAFLTNDATLHRVTDLQVIVLESYLPT